MTQVQGRVAVITGGASGIGLGIAQAFGEAGARVVLLDVEAAALERARAELEEALGAQVMTVPVDVTDRDGLAGARDRICESLGGVQLLFNNAGVNVPGNFRQLTFRDWDWVMGVNLGGVVNGIMTFLPELLRHPDAHVINTASVGGLVGMPGLGIYNASKFAVVGLSEALRADMLDTGLRVSVLCPGVVDTALGSSERNRPAHLANPRSQHAEPSPGAGAAQSPPPVTPQPSMTPRALGKQVLEAVLRDEFFICTHDEFRDIVAERNDALLASFGSAADPAMTAAMRRLVVPF